MESDIIEAWHINNSMNYLLLNSVPDEALEARYSPKTRTVAAQFAHMHNVRVSHLEGRAVDLVGDLKGFPRGAQPEKTELRTALEASEQAVAKMLAQFARDGKVKSWNGAPVTYLSYFISHESHHRGLALVALRLSGVKIPKEITYGLWYWRRRKPGE